MPQYRNVSGDDRFVDIPGRGLVLVLADAVIDIPDSDRYVQTGETGEPPIFELLAAKKSDTVKGA